MARPCRTCTGFHPRRACSPYDPWRRCQIALLGHLAPLAFIKRSRRPEWMRFDCKVTRTYFLTRWFPSGIKRERGAGATPYAAAAPATVSDEPLSLSHWAAWTREGESGVDPRARRPAITDVRAESAGRGVLGARTPVVGASPAMTENVRRLTHARIAQISFRPGESRTRWRGSPGRRCTILFDSIQKLSRRPLRMRCGS